MSRFLFLFFGGGFFIITICNLMLCVIFCFGYAELKVLGSAFWALIWEESIIFCSTWNIWTARCLKASVQYSYSAVQFISRNCLV